MKCFFCGKEQNINNTEPPPKWFGRYRSDKLTHVICLACIRIPANLEKWRDWAAWK